MDSTSPEVPTQSTDSKAGQRGQEMAVVPSLAHSVHPIPNMPCTSLVDLVMPSVVNEPRMGELPSCKDTHGLLPSSLRGRAEVSEALCFFSAVAFCDA